MTKLGIASAALVAAAIVTTLLPARNPLPAPSGQGSNVRVGLVFDVGGRGDKSFNDSAWIGLERASRELGVRVEVMEPTSAEDREAAMRLFAARGFDIVLGVGFIFSSEMNVVARAFPASKFACVDYAPPSDGAIPPNVAGLVFREEEGSFMVGAVAGLISKSHAVGFVGGMDVPLIHKFEAGYIAGVHHVCAECRVHAAYAGATPEAFKDPAKGEALATSQISAGADVVFHASGTTGLGVFEAARDMGVRAIGVDADQYDEMPGVVVTSMIKRVDVVVFETIREVTLGTFRGGIKAFGLKENGIGYVDEGPHAAGIPADVKTRVGAIKAEIVEGKIAVPSKN
ncbi:MAG: BMP family ABC transporter substrate-binding protein [Deltaproteobacteria bacterium]|nr:BMP family ABC transporter substrate-binding protein [Deltaproteobacteria bacterium]